MKMCHSVPCGVVGKKMKENAFEISPYHLCPLVIHFQSNLTPNSKKIPHLQKNPASAIKWLGLGVIQVSIFERKVSLARKSINREKCFRISFSDRATFAHAAFSGSLLNGLNLGRGIMGQDQTQGELIAALKALLPCLDSTQGFRF